MVGWLRWLLLGVYSGELVSPVRTPHTHNVALVDVDVDVDVRSPVVGPPRLLMDRKERVSAQPPLFSLMLPDLKEDKARPARGTTRTATQALVCVCWSSPPASFPRFEAEGRKPIISLLKLNTFCKCWGLDTTLSRRAAADGLGRTNVPVPAPVPCEPPPLLFVPSSVCLGGW